MLMNCPPKETECQIMIGTGLVQARGNIFALLNHDFKLKFPWGRWDWACLCTLFSGTLLLTGRCLSIMTRSTFQGDCKIVRLQQGSQAFLRCRQNDSKSTFINTLKCWSLPVYLAPEAMTALCTRWPYRPLPPNAGSKPGWMFKIARGKRCTSSTDTSCRNMNPRSN